MDKGSAVDAVYDPNLNARLLLALVSSCPFDLMGVFQKLMKFFVDFFARYPCVIPPFSFPSYLSSAFLFISLFTFVYLGVEPKYLRYYFPLSITSFSHVVLI
jgi:hypothetical protein